MQVLGIVPQSHIEYRDQRDCGPRGEEGEDPRAPAAVKQQRRPSEHQYDRQYKVLQTRMRHHHEVVEYAHMEWEKRVSSIECDCLRPRKQGVKSAYWRGGGGRPFPRPPSPQQGTTPKQGGRESPPRNGPRPYSL